MDILNTQAPTEDRLPWHKPEVQMLVITLDTGLEAPGATAPFSLVDGPTHG
jgi:hypothetical protein